jgi:hypothetical protein
MKDFSPILIVFGLTAVLIIGFLFFAKGGGSYNPQAEYASVEEILVEPTHHDFGTISMAKGKVETEFKLKNTSEKPLKIRQLQTSCMCTEAVMRIGDKESPVFGMHANPTWLEDFPAQTEATIKVVFDPAAHGPGGVGKIERVVQVLFAEPENGVKEMHLSAEVTS